jgi:hypothetical protein
MSTPLRAWRSTARHMSRIGMASTTAGISTGGRRSRSRPPG